MMKHPGEGDSIVEEEEGLEVAVALQVHINNINKKVFV